MGLNHHRESTHSNVERFINKKYQKEVEINKSAGEQLGMRLIATGPHAVIPGIVVKEITIGSPAHKSGTIKIGDQIMSVNGASLIGMKFPEIVRLVRGVSKDRKVELEIIDGCGKIIAFRRQTPNPSEKMVLENANLFLNPQHIITVIVQKRKKQPLGIQLTITGKDAVIPSVFISTISAGGAVRASRKLQIGDQILKINGFSTVGLTSSAAYSLMNNCSKETEIQFKIARIKKITNHNIYSDSHGISLSSGCVLRVDPETEAAKAGIKSGMHIMEIDEESYYGRDDVDILTCLEKEGSKTVVCMSPIESKHSKEGNDECKDLKHQSQQLHQQQSSVITSEIQEMQQIHQEQEYVTEKEEIFPLEYI